MNANHDRLDEAIDRIAKRLTRVEDGAALANRILASLPDRSPWLLHSWIPRLAITAMLAAAASLVVLRMFDGRSTDVRRTEVASAPLVEFRAAVERTSAEPELIVRRTIVERQENDRRTIDAPDHEYSLREIDSPKALSVSVLASESLLVEEALSLAPLTIAELPLTAETISPR